MKHMIAATTLAACTLLCAANASAEPRVYLNNVDITYVRSQYFENVNVSIDSAGNINIVGDRYKISRKTENGVVSENDGVYQTPDDVKKAQDDLQQSLITLPANDAPVYLVAQINQPSLLGHSVAVYINGKLVSNLPQTEAQKVINVTPYLIKGTNKIQYKMNKEASAGSSSRATITINYAKVSNETSTNLELSGNYAEMTLKAVDGEKTYDLTLINP